MYASVYKRGGYPTPPILPIGNSCCPPVPGIVSIWSEALYSTFTSTFVTSTFLSTVNYPPYGTFTSTITTSTLTSNVYFPNGLYLSTNFVNVANVYRNVAESARIQAQECTTAYISNAPVPVLPGNSNNVPYIDLIPKSASLTTQQLATAVLVAGNNPYNPATRFSQYRFSNTVLPPAPPCPVAVPNPTTLRPCVPPTVFRGSVQNVPPR